MIVRILGEGQFRVSDDAATKLTELDGELAAAVDKGDETAFKTVLGASISLVRAEGAPLPADEFATAECILPFSDATVAEVRELLADGKIPGDSIGRPAPGSGNV